MGRHLRGHVPTQSGAANHKTGRALYGVDHLVQDCHLQVQGFHAHACPHVHDICDMYALCTLGSKRYLAASTSVGAHAWFHVFSIGWIETQNLLQALHVGACSFRRARLFHALIGKCYYERNCCALHTKLAGQPILWKLGIAPKKCRTRQGAYCRHAQPSCIKGQVKAAHRIW